VWDSQRRSEGTMMRRARKDSTVAGAAGRDSPASRNCCTTQRAFGFRVALKCRILRRSWPITKKHANTEHQKWALGRLKESIAAMDSRWFLRNVSHRFTGSGFLGAG